MATRRAQSVRRAVPTASADWGDENADETNVLTQSFWNEHGNLTDAQMHSDMPISSTTYNEDELYLCAVGYVRIYTVTYAVYSF